MVAQPQIGQYWTVDQYLEMERGSPIRHELIDGRVYAMSGGDQRHSRISLNVGAALIDRIGAGPCQVFNSDMKVRLPNERDHVYPDVSVTCDERDLVDDQADFIRYPSIVVEVLSDSTERYDRSAKFDMYRARGTLREYVLIETRMQSVEVRECLGDGTWTTTIYSSGDDILLPSMAALIPIDAVYRGFAF